MKKSKFIAISSLCSIGILTIPTLTSCAQSLNFQKGDVVDSSSTGSSGNNTSLTVGTIADEIKNSSLSNDASVHLMTANKEIEYYDYQNPSIDTNGQYIYIHDRGSIVKKQLNANPMQNKNNFVKTFNFYDYQKQWNDSIDATNSGYSKIKDPSSELFLQDIYSWLLQIWNTNDKFFNIDIAEKDVLFSRDANTNKLGNLSFDLKFNITNVNNKTLPLKIYNKEVQLRPNHTYTLSLKAESQPIENIINDSNGRFFLAWTIPAVSIQITNLLNLNVSNFQPITKTYSNAYQIEFINLTTDKQYSGNEASSKEFMNSLDSNKIKSMIEPEFTNDLKNTLNFLPYINSIFTSLESNPTLGKFLYDIAPFAEYLVNQLNIAPSDFGTIVKELLQSVYTGKGVIDIIVEYKEQLANSLKVILAPLLGPMTELVYTILTPIKPDMTKDEVDGFKKLIDMFTLPKDTKTLILKIIDVLMGTYDADGNLTQKGNPYILDLLDYLIIDMKDAFVKMFNIDEELFNIISTVYQMFTARTKVNGVTDTSSGNVNFNTKIVDALFDIKYNDDYTKTTWWVIDTLKSVLKIMGVDFKEQADLINGIIQQVYAHNLNKVRLNKQNFLAMVKEFKNFLTFISDVNSYKLEGSWLKVNDNVTDNDFEYDKETYQAKFKYQQKIVFNKDYTFNVASIINFLPSDVFLELSALVGDSVNVIGQNFNAKGQYLRVNLDRLIYGFLPKSITIKKGDSYNQIFTLKDNQLFYSQKVVEQTNYNAINGLFEIESYFDQAAKDSGIISSWLSSVLSTNDYNESLVKDDFKMNQNTGKVNVAAQLFYEEKTNKQSKQNLAISKSLVQNLLINTKHTSKQLFVYDKESIVDNSLGYNHNIYTDGYTFKWLDTDLSQEFILADTNPQFKSKKYDEYKNLVKSTSVNNRSYNFTYISDSNGTKANDSVSANNVYFDSDTQSTLKNELFVLGEGFSDKDYAYSISPLFNLDVSKLVDLGAGMATSSTNPLLLIWKELKINIQLYAYQVSVSLKTNALNLTNLYTVDNQNKLDNYSYNNYYSKTIIAPRISLVIPSFT